MSTHPLPPAEIELLRSVFIRHPAICAVRIFGSRARGTHTNRSDVDLALWGQVNSLEAEQVAAELDELPLPYRYDVKPFDSINLEPLRAHIEHAGIPIYSKAMQSDH